jgi:hypothetical protein
MYGTAREDFRLVLVGEPRNRDLRFAALAAFATDINEWLGRFHRTEIQTRPARGRRPATTTRECVNAPQIIVPNPSTAKWLFGTLGRALRYLRPDGDNPVDASIPLLGANLTFLDGRRVIPGSCLSLVAAEVLTQHWVTGQTEPEDVNLATALAWIDPPEGQSGVQAAEEAEASVQPAGPVPDPGWDADVLEGVIDSYRTRRRGGVPEDKAIEELRDVVVEALLPAYNGCFDAVALVTDLPEAASVSTRWANDRWFWTRHVERVLAGAAHFRRVLSPLGAASLLARAEDAVSELERQMALDDPLVMARILARGEGLSSEVLSVDVDNVEPGRGRATVRRPLLRVAPDEVFDRPVGTTLFLVDNPRVATTVWDLAPDGTVTLKVHGGHGRNRDDALSALPDVGDRATFTPIGSSSFYPNTLPDEVPWTHLMPVADGEDAE